MRSRVLSGVVAGVAAGVAFGLIMQVIPIPGVGRMMNMVAAVIGAQSAMAGWAYHLFNSAAIGAIFGWLLGGSIHNFRRGVLLGVLYGLSWWVIGGLILMPLALGMRAFTPLTVETLNPVAFISLIGHLVYGLLLGVGYATLWSGAHVANYQAPTQQDRNRAA